MSDRTFDVLGIGNAIVDIISMADETTLTVLELPKGTMSLVDEQRAEFLYNYISCIKEDFLSPPKEMSGGCAANTVAGITSFGGNAAFIGKVRNDYYGKRFVTKLRERGIAFDSQYSQGTEGTARSLIIVDQSDASRTMCTFLGAARDISEDDIEEEKIANASITFIEGYLLDCTHGKAAIQKAMDYAHKHGNKVGFTLSDPLCVKRHHEDLLRMVENDIDILFANKNEINALCDTDDFLTSVQVMETKCVNRGSIAALTCGQDGVVVVDSNYSFGVEAEKVMHAVDSTGTGDMFVSGFLYGMTHGLALPQCAVLGNKAAAEVLLQLGARPKTDLSKILDLVSDESFVIDVKTPKSLRDNAA